MKIILLWYYLSLMPEAGLMVVGPFPTEQICMQEKTADPTPQWPKKCFALEK